MTELELYKFLEGEDYEHQDYIIWIPIYSLEKFCAFFKSYLIDGGIECRLKDDCVALDIYTICDFYGINPENIYGK